MLDDKEVALVELVKEVQRLMKKETNAQDKLKGANKLLL